MILLLEDLLLLPDIAGFSFSSFSLRGKRRVDVPGVRMSGYEEIILLGLVVKTGNEERRNLQMNDIIQFEEVSH